MLHRTALAVGGARRASIAAALALATLLACGDDGAVGRSGQVGSADAEPLPVLFSLPPFTLTDQDARPFGSEQLVGRVWVADFIFTECPGMCPILSRRMAALQDALRGDPAFDDVRLVSFSVDPETDTPEVLRAYADRHGAEPGRWSLLTGSREAIWELSKEGFRLAVAESPGSEEGPFLHSGKLVLVDRESRIRGYYDGLEPQSQAALLADLRQLARAPTSLPDPAGADVLGARHPN